MLDAGMYSRGIQPLLQHKIRQQAQQFRIARYAAASRRQDEITGRFAAQLVGAVCCPVVEKTLDRVGRQLRVAVQGA